MDRRKELAQQYKETEIEAGIFQIRNSVNGKIYVSSSRNLKNLNGKRFELNAGSSMQRLLQAEWNEYGEEAFVFEILELLEKEKSEFFDEKDALKKLEESWLEKLKPYGDRGYNKENPDASRK
ncbi:GIY-YIG nuclease family protein [Paenibacillus lutrae]|uniref:GIY-YIG nuclease family protein n=1 Tax=Paenibacillus lutrae TaxID=2078573 RepID=A0A7X3FK61_9BACL|nr:GIY-YIG nuclease family protein [Paenibacillus lutrae]MVP01140.1 GIY-YIG nuclease family protein [Paenibacillus lutrae]